MTGKWRPPLWFVLGGGLVGTLGLSFVGLIALRYAGPEIGFRNAALVIAACIAALTTVLGWLLVRLLLRPINILRDYAQAIREGRAPPHPTQFGTPELEALGQSVIEMGGVLRRREASIRTYSNHVTHELKTPVSALRAAVELLEDSDSGNASDARIRARMADALDQIESQLAALRAMAAAQEPGHQGHSSLDALTPELRARHPELSLEFEGAEIPLPLAASGLFLVFGHLLSNAAAHGADRVAITVGEQGLDVADNGPGLSPANAAQMFEPFFTTRRDNGGTGMGLAIVRAVLEAHGWSIARAPAAVGLTLRLIPPQRPPGP
ncbi:MAG: HAMP domain-containing sensor histidine kinase [Pseudomonadota bacterium]